MTDQATTPVDATAQSTTTAANTEATTGAAVAPAPATTTAAVAHTPAKGRGAAKHDASAHPHKEKVPKEKQAPAQQHPGGGAKGGAKGAKGGPKPTAAASSAAAPAKNQLGIETRKADDFAEWYSQVITRSEMIDYYDISGCYILRPWAYTIWEKIQAFFDAEIKKLGVQNAYFPCFVSGHALQKEESELHGFEAEVAWVTRSGQTALHEPIAVRPTSETVMYPAFRNWISSYRDLPLKVNQWCNVVRWEFKRPVPFIRTREFLWQEGHSAFATLQEAEQEVMTILDLYAQVYEDLLAVPVVKGRKSEKEKFAGALYTTTIEAFIPTNGRAVQAATSHCLGQTFSKMFGVEFKDEKLGKQFVWQNSWGLTTRTIGVMTMVHGDDNGLVLPPRVAPIQVVVIPIHTKGQVDTLDDRAYELASALKGCGLRVHVDAREGYNPGWKFNHWELKGIPVRIEIGPKDIIAQQVVVCRRDTRAKENVPWTRLGERVVALMDEIHANLLNTARATRDSRIAHVSTWADFMTNLNKRNLCQVPWCKSVDCEKHIKTRSGVESTEIVKAAALHPGEEEGMEGLTGAAKSLCVPFQQPALPANTVCFACGAPALCYALFGRSY
ncbi:prolyl-tRNA synthetase [Pelomyxa schiedti]|nr:prolyl-tRNA synthetase [Pelomyxa schiedti]